MTVDNLKLRFVEVRGVRYIRLEDAAQFVRVLGGTEETDVRDRLNEAADRLITAKGQGRSAS